MLCIVYTHTTEIVCNSQLCEKLGEKFRGKCKCCMSYACTVEPCSQQWECYSEMNVTVHSMIMTWRRHWNHQYTMETYGH